MSSTAEHTYDYICFTDLVYEFNSDQQKKVEAKIKRRLKYHKLGKYDQARVDLIRQIKTELSNEISLGQHSKYFYKSASTCTEMKDFDMDKMTSDLYAKYPSVDEKELYSMTGFAVYYFYTR